MHLSVRGNDVTISPELREFATTRVSRLDRLVEHLVDAKLELKRVHRRSGANIIIAQLTIQSGRDLLRAEESDDDAEKAIGLVAEKMETRIRKVNERRKLRKKTGRTPLAIEPILAEEESDELVDEDGEAFGAIVRTKRFELKPMDLDEAIEQMELLGHDFFLFHNREENGVNLLYRRKDGAYGLLAGAER